MSVKYKGHYSRPLTPALVEEVANMPAFAGERPKSSARIKMLRARLDDGLFYAPRWGFAKVGNKKYRVNGQHSSHVLAECNGAFPKGLQAIMDEWECDTENDLAELFSQFDHRTSGRSASDITGAHAKIHPELFEIRNTWVTRLVAGISAHLNNLEGAKYISAEDRARHVHEYPEYIKQFAAIKTGWIVRFVGASAAMFGTWVANPGEAFTFWNLVATESHPDPDDSTRTLSDWLKRSAMQKSKPAMREVYVRCIHAWNAYRGGDSTMLRYFKNAPTPKIGK